MKLRSGGLVEVEFVAQALQLVHLAPEGAHEPVTRRALERLAGCGALGADDAALLIEADRFWRTVQSVLRIAVGAGGAPSASAAEPLLRATGADSLAALEARMDETARAVHDAFVRCVGEAG